MKFEDKKVTILKQLSKENNPISLSDLLVKLGSDYSERSLRRWLSEMIIDGLVYKTGSRKAVRYQVVNKIIEKTDRCFGLESQKIIEQISRPIYQRNHVAYNDNWFDSYKPNTTFYIPLETRLELEAIGRRYDEEPAGTYAHQIYNRLLIDLSYNSSRLEGNTYSLLDTQQLIFEGKSVEGKLEEEKIMILNHKEAIRYLVDNAPKLDISEETICTIHYLLADGLVETNLAGKIRNYGVRIGGSTYIPFEDKKHLISRFNSIIEKAAMIKNPFEQSLFLLIHITYLQGFVDVNKRTARLSANIPLIKYNFVPLSFNDIDREDYTSAIIAVYELQNILPILELYTYSYKRTCTAYDSTVKSIGFDEVRVRYRRQRRDIVGHIVVNLLTGTKIREYIDAQIKKLIKEEDQELFFEDVIEDLKAIDSSRIAGLGITKDQLYAWIELNKYTLL